MTTPRVSVIMPTFNQGWFIRYALDSLARQTYRDFELVVVNDGSTDDTRAVLSAWVKSQLDGFHDSLPRPEITVIHQANRGTASAINAGIAEARGAMLSWISSDNLCAPTWLERLVAAIDAGAGCAYGGFGYVRVGSRDEQIGIANEIAGATLWVGIPYLYEPYHPAKQIAQEACYLGPAHLIRREVWAEHRGRISHDLDHFLRVEENCWRAGLPIIGVDECLCLYFAHNERASVTRKHEYSAPAILAEARKRRA